VGENGPEGAWAKPKPTGLIDSSKGDTVGRPTRVGRQMLGQFLPAPQGLVELHGLSDSKQSGDDDEGPDQQRSPFNPRQETNGWPGRRDRYRQGN
jgi:hypothetical protein